MGINNSIRKKRKTYKTKLSKMKRKKRTKRKKRRKLTKLTKYNRKNNTRKKRQSGGEVEFGELRQISRNFDNDHTIKVYKSNYDEAKILWEKNKGGWFSTKQAGRRIHLDHALALLYFVVKPNDGGNSPIDELKSKMGAKEIVKLTTIKTIEKQAKGLQGKIMLRLSAFAKKTLKSLKDGITKKVAKVTNKEVGVPKLVIYDELVNALNELLLFLRDNNDPDIAVYKGMLDTYNEQYNRLKLELRIVKGDKSFKYYKLLEAVESILDSLDILGSLDVQASFNTSTEGDSIMKDAANDKTYQGTDDTYDVLSGDFLTLGRKCYDTCQLLESLLQPLDTSDYFKTLLEMASEEWKAEYITNETLVLGDNSQRIELMINKADEEHNRRKQHIKNIHTLLQIRYRQVLFIAGDLTDDDKYYKECKREFDDLRIDDSQKLSGPEIDDSHKLSGPEIVESLYPTYWGKQRIFPFNGVHNESHDIPPHNNLVKVVVDYNIKRKKRLRG